MNGEYRKTVRDASDSDLSHFAEAHIGKAKRQQIQKKTRARYIAYSI